MGAGGFSMSEVLEQLGRLPVLMSWHIVLTMLAVGVGLLISVPAGIAAAKVDRLRGPLLTLASIIQTIPSLALLALVFALLTSVFTALMCEHHEEAHGHGEEHGEHDEKGAHAH